LAQWEGSVTHHSGVTMSTRGEMALRRGKRGDDASWADVNLTRLKNEENLRDRFNWYKWTVKI
jgi:hypothetical protein